MTDEPKTTVHRSFSSSRQKERRRKINWCSGYRVKTANHPASDCWDATVGAAISRPKPYGFQSTPFCRKRAMIEPFRAADSRPYGSNVRCFHGCCSKPIAYIGVCRFPNMLWFCSRGGIHASRVRGTFSPKCRVKPEHFTAGSHKLYRVVTWYTSCAMTWYTVLW